MKLIKGCTTYAALGKTEPEAVTLAYATESTMTRSHPEGTGERNPILVPMAQNGNYSPELTKK